MADRPDFNETHCHPHFLAIALTIPDEVTSAVIDGLLAVALIGGSGGCDSANNRIPS